MLITEETQAISNEPFPPEVRSCLPALSTMYGSTYLYVLRDHNAFMSPESCSKVLSAAGKPRHIPRARFLFRLSLRVYPFLRWPGLKSFSSTHRFQLGKIWSHVNLLYQLLN